MYFRDGVVKMKTRVDSRRFPSYHLAHMIMKTRFASLSLVLAALVSPVGFAQTPATDKAAEVAPLNGLTEAEKAEGWVMLWDGKTMDGWRSPKSEEFPKSGWKMSDGILSTVANGGKESAGGGDIITRKRYADFELKVDFRITPGANSGIKIFVQPSITPISAAGQPTAVGSAIGMEFQILDDRVHPDAKLGKKGNRTIGSLYDLITAPASKKVNLVGEWNNARIVSKGKRVEFFLNGVKTVEFERGSEAFRKLVAGSKYGNIPNFGDWEDGHIMLQEHGDAVSFCNVKLRELVK